MHRAVGHSDTDTCADSHSGAGAAGDPHAYTDSHASAGGDTTGRGDAHSYRWLNVRSKAYPDAAPHTHIHAYANADSHAYALAVLSTA